jgi:hypothetical protein
MAKAAKTPGDFRTRAMSCLQTLRHHPVPSTNKIALRPKAWMTAQQFLLVCAAQS